MLFPLRYSILQRCVPQLSRHFSTAPTLSSQYHPGYIEPIPDKKELAKLEETKEITSLLYQPVKALVSDRPVSVFYDELYAYFIRLTMHKRQRRNTARVLMEETFIYIKLHQFKKYNEATTPEEKAEIVLDPFIIFQQAIKNCMPLMLTRAVKRGGATYQVPYPLSEKYARFSAARWLLEVVRDRPRPRLAHFPEVMAKELIAAFNNEGKVIKKKQDMHRLCEQNRAYAHYRWG